MKKPALILTLVLLCTMTAFSMVKPQEELVVREQALLQKLGNKPADPKVLCQLAEVYFYLGDWYEGVQQIKLWQSGVDYAEMAIEIEPNSADAHYWLAALSGKIGNAQGILQSLVLANTMFEHLEIALELDPDHAWAHFVFSHLYDALPKRPLGRGDREKALKLAKAAYELDVTEPEFSVHYVDLLVKQRQFDQARQVVEEALENPLVQWTPQLRSRAEDQLASLVGR